MNRKKDMILSKHAEENVLYNFYKRNRNYRATKRLTLIVIRVNNNNKLINSKPCSHCLEVMKYYGVKKVIYSNIDGTLTTEIIRNMTCKSSKGYRSTSKIITKLTCLL